MNKNIRLNESGGSSLNSTYREMEADVRMFEVSLEYLEYVVRLFETEREGRKGRKKSREVRRLGGRGEEGEWRKDISQ